MSEEERTFYRLAKERGDALERAQDVIEDLTAENERLRLALKGFTDVLGRHGLSSSEELDSALCAWAQNIQEGSDVWMIQTTVPDNRFEIVHGRYDPVMQNRIGDTLFTSAEAAAEKLRELVIASCEVRA